MCLYIKENKGVEKSEKSIKVFKILRMLDPHTATSPFYSTSYTQGELKEVSEFSDGSGYRFSTKQDAPPYLFSINKGLHTYTTKTAAIKRIREVGCYRIVVACTIPRRTPFILGQNSEIVSLKLRIGKAITSTPDTRHYKNAFNKRKAK